MELNKEQQIIGGTLFMKTVGEANCNGENTVA
jgi:hypothetical protein